LWDKYFTGSGVEFNKDAEKLCKQVKLTTSQLLNLCAIPNDSNVSLAWKENWTEVEIPDGEQVPSGLHVTVINSELIASANEFILFTEPSGSQSIYFKLIDLRPRLKSNTETVLKGLAGKIVATIVSEAQKLSFTRIRLLAAGGRTWPDREPGVRWGGYAAWPLYGFNMEILESDIALHEFFKFFPKYLSTYGTVLALRAAEGGLDYWKICGSGDYMEFDLSAESESIHRLKEWEATKSREEIKMTTQVRKPMKINTSQPAQFAGNLPIRQTSKTPTILRSLNNADSPTSIQRLKALRRAGGAEIPFEILD
jgi:hypothetical protein